MEKPKNGNWKSRCGSEAPLETLRPRVYEHRMFHFLHNGLEVSG